MTQNENYIPNNGIKEFNEAVAEHWTFYITTCQDRELFYRDYPFWKNEDMPKERVHDLYRVANLPDITLTRQMGFPFNTDFSGYRLEFAEYIRNEGKVYKNTFPCEDCNEWNGEAKECSHISCMNEEFWKEGKE